MDRNCLAGGAANGGTWSLSARRAWIEISLLKASKTGASGSLSARRAWIEIVRRAITAHPIFPVALRKESVDRNVAMPAGASSMLVALRKESVDRNSMGRDCGQYGRCRSPQGERG